MEELAEAAADPLLGKAQRKAARAQLREEKRRLREEKVCRDNTDFCAQSPKTLLIFEQFSLRAYAICSLESYSDEGEV